MSTPATNHLRFRRYIKRKEGTSVRAVEVTPDNVHQIRTLWKHPEAEIGQFYVRFPVNTAKLMDPNHFKKIYRDPA